MERKCQVDLFSKVLFCRIDVAVQFTIMRSTIIVELVPQRTQSCHVFPRLQADVNLTKIGKPKYVAFHPFSITQASSREHEVGASEKAVVRGNAFCGLAKSRLCILSSIAALHRFGAFHSVCCSVKHTCTAKTLSAQNTSFDVSGSPSKW